MLKRKRSEFCEAIDYTKIPYSHDALILWQEIAFELISFFLYIERRGFVLLLAFCFRASWHYELRIYNYTLHA